MYLHKLEKDEKTAFLSLAKHLARVDDAQIDEREEYMIRYMCAEMGIGYDAADVAPFDLDGIARVFFREKARRIALLEAVGVCIGSGSMDSAQQDLLEELRRRFDLAPDFIPRASGIVTRQLAVMEEFETMVDKG